jgi:hypothetical protein
MISFISNNEFIYDFLEKEGRLPSAFSADVVFDYENEDAYFLIIYDSVKRNFFLLKSDAYMQDMRELSMLIEVVQENMEASFSSRTAQKAIQILEDKIQYCNSRRSFFDAH